MSLVRESRDAPRRHEWFNARSFCVVVGAVALVYIATIGVSGWKATHGRTTTPRTFGAAAIAKRHVTGDSIVWEMTVTAHGADRAAAVRELRASAETARAYLANHEIKAAEMSLYPMVTEEDFQTITRRTADGSESSEDVPHGFNATQKIQVRSPDVARILRAFRVATSAAELAPAEIVEPLCSLSTLDQLRTELAAIAHREVRKNAEDDVAAMGGARLGKLVNTEAESFNANGLMTNSLTVCEHGTDVISEVRAVYQLQ